MHIFNWEIYKEDISTPDKPFDYIEISIEEFYEFRDNIIDNGYNEGLGAERENWPVRLGNMNDRKENQ